MKPLKYSKIAGLMGVCILAINCLAYADIQVLESAFCLKAGLNCDKPLPSEAIDITQIRSDKNGAKRLYFWSKIAASEDYSVIHVWSKKGGINGSSPPVYLYKSSKLRDLPPEAESAVHENLIAKYNANKSVNSIQGVMLHVGRSSGYRTYSNIGIIPGEYTVEIYDLDGNIIAGGEAKTVKISGMLE